MNKLYYAELEELKKTVKLSSRKLNELTIAEIQNLRIIKSEGLPSSDFAEGLLIMNGDSIIEHPIRKINLDAYTNTLDSLAIDSFNYNLSISPNPASNFIEVSYLLPAGTTQATIRLIDQYNNVGQEVFAVTLTGEQSNYNINVNSIANGYYSALLEINGNVKMTKLLQIIR
ncbi:MAG: hypothetical protein ACI8ZX_002123 [Planctomycetota bacterium]|jgi:hypothetical protein